MTIVRGALLLSLLSLACRRPLPEGLDRALIDEAIKYAEATAPACDQLVERPCYDGPKWPDPADPSLPKVPGWKKLTDDRRVRELGAYCYARRNRIGGDVSCSAERITKSPQDDKECLMATAPGWPTADISKVGEYVGVIQNGKCKYPWYTVNVMRRSPAGNDFVVNLSTLPTAYLDAHPEVTSESRGQGRP